MRRTGIAFQLHARRIARHVAPLSFIAGIALVSHLLVDGSWNSAWPIICFVATLGALMAARWGWRIREGLPDFSDQGKPQRNARLREIDLNQEELILAAELLLNPAAYVSRIVHEVRAEEGHLSNRVTRELTLPKLEKDGKEARAAYALFVPLMFIERGLLVDNLTTGSSESSRAPVVESGISRYLTGKILRFLALDVFAQCDADVCREAEQLLEDLQPILQTDVSYEQAPGDTKAAQRALVALSELTGPDSDAWRRRRARVVDLWRAALTSYVIFGEVPANPGNKLSISVEYTTPMSVDRAGFTARPHSSREGLSKEHLRYVIGLRPYVYRFPLTWELATRSYHLRFDQPSDQYIYSVHVERHGEGSQPGHTVVIRDAASTVTRYAHVYVRWVANAKPSGELHVRVDARERPPGLLGLTALVALIQSTFFLFILFAYPWLFVDQNPDPDFMNYVPALLLSIPGLFSAWLANQLTPERTQRTSLAAAGGIAINGGLAVVGTLVAVAAVHDKEWLILSDGRIAAWVLGNPLWLTLAMVSVWHACNMLGRFTQNTVIFLSRLRQKAQLSYFEV